MPASRLVSLLDQYKALHGTPDTELARRIGISRQNLSLWRSNGLRALPARVNLESVATVIGVPYRRVLDAALHDSGYLSPAAAVNESRTYAEVLTDAIDALTEATRLSVQRFRSMPGGGWEPDPTAVPDPIDWAEFVCAALAGAAANAGGIDTVLAGRPGSWEAARVRDTLHSTVGDDFAELMRHRTDPVEVVVHPERILFDHDDSTWFDDYDAANAELDDREDTIQPSYVYSWPGHELSDEARAYYATRNVVIVEGPPPPVPTAEEIQAAIADSESRPLSDTERAELAEQGRRDAAHDAITALRDRLEAQQRAELAAYGQSLAQAITAGLAALELRVPMSVTVDLETPFGDAPETPDVGFATGLDAIIASAIADADTPDLLPGTPLERLDTAAPADPTRRLT